MSESKVILVTGANTGIGYALVRLLAEKGHTVYIGARNAASGKDAQEALIKEGLKPVKFVLLDVTDLTTIQAAKETIQAAEGRLDVLVNNAGIGRVEANQASSTVAVEVIEDVMKTNFYGLIQTTTTFIPLLRKSFAPVILNVSSELGSNAHQASPTSKHHPAAYSTSKAAVNSYTIGLAQELRTEGFKVNAVTPGLVMTKLNGFMQGGRSVREGGESLMGFALLDKDGPTGKFFGPLGQELLW